LGKGRRHSRLIVINIVVELPHPFLFEVGVAAEFVAQSPFVDHFVCFFGERRWGDGLAYMVLFGDMQA